MTQNKRVQTSVEFFDGWDKLIEKPIVINATMHSGTDLVTGINRITVFTDDGKGNGLPIFEFDLE